MDNLRVPDFLILNKNKTNFRFKFVFIFWKLRRGLIMDWHQQNRMGQNYGLYNLGEYFTKKTAGMRYWDWDKKTFRPFREKNQISVSPFMLLTNCCWAATFHSLLTLQSNTLDPALSVSSNEVDIRDERSPHSSHLSPCFVSSFRPRGVLPSLLS